MRHDSQEELRKHTVNGGRCSNGNCGHEGEESNSKLHRAGIEQETGVDRRRMSEFEEIKGGKKEDYKT